MATTAPVSLTLSRWSTKIASDCSTADLSTVPSNSSIFICCQCHYVNRPHFTASALHDSDFSSVTCTKSVSRPRKWIDSDTACSSKPNTVAYCNSKNDVTSVSNSKDGVRAWSFKSLFGKRSVWRRILFASKKVRSIILLNAITVVNGKPASVWLPRKLRKMTGFDQWILVEFINLFHSQLGRHHRCIGTRGCLHSFILSLGKWYIFLSKLTNSHN